MSFTPTRALTAVGVGAALALIPFGVAVAEPAPPGSNPILSSQPSFLGDDARYNNENNWTYWLTEAGYPGVVCVKSGANNATSYTLGAPPAGSSWILLILKAGADPSTGGQTNNLFWSPQQGQTKTHSSGKQISHVIRCSSTVTTTTTTTGTSTTTTGTSTTTTGTSTTTTGTSTTTTGTSTTTTGTSTTTTGTSTTTTGTSTTTQPGTSTTTSPATGPVVETDQPGGPGSMGMLAGAAAILAAIGIALNRRRESADH